MAHINQEIKARISEEKEKEIRNYLLKFAKKMTGIDYQIDTYFKVDNGKLKFRKSIFGDELIYYNRENKKDVKQSNVLVFQNQGKTEDLEKITRATHDVLTEVKKRREIYSIENVIFDIDKVEDLGTFIEIKAKSELNPKTGETITPINKLKEQCNHYKNLFKIKESDLIENSYSDMLLELKEMQKKG